jgi:hypothetical protein
MPCPSEQSNMDSLIFIDLMPLYVNALAYNALESSPRP